MILREDDADETAMTTKEAMRGDDFVLEAEQTGIAKAAG